MSVTGVVSIILLLVFHCYLTQPHAMHATQTQQNLRTGSCHFQDFSTAFHYLGRFQDTTDLKPTHRISGLFKEFPYLNEPYQIHNYFRFAAAVLKFDIGSIR
jgi:hypothetical protein